MLKQTLTVVPQGLIESGVVTLSIDQITGAVSENHDIKAGVSIFSQEIVGQNTYAFPPAYLLSSNLAVGMKWTIGIVTCTVTAISIQDKSASLSIVAENTTTNLIGTAMLDTSGEYLVIEQVMLQGTVNGYNIILQLQEEQ